MSLALGGPGLGFAYLSLATTSTRIARKYHDSAVRTDSPLWRKTDADEWRRLKRQAWRAIENSSMCERPQLP